MAPTTNDDTKIVVPGNGFLLHPLCDGNRLRINYSVARFEEFVHAMKCTKYVDESSVIPQINTLIAKMEATLRMSDEELGKDGPIVDINTSMNEIQARQDKFQLLRHVILAVEDNRHSESVGRYIHRMVCLLADGRNGRNFSLNVSQPPPPPTPATPPKLVAKAPCSLMLEGASLGGFAALYNRLIQNKVYDMQPGSSHESALVGIWNRFVDEIYSAACDGTLSTQQLTVVNGPVWTNHCGHAQRFWETMQELFHNCAPSLPPNSVVATMCLAQKAM